jgi:hypothetical protein
MQQTQILLLEDKRFFVYIYFDPKTLTPKYAEYKFEFEPFYVGKGKGKRHLQHVKDAKNTNKNSPKLIKIRALKAQNLIPIITIIKDCLNEKSAFELEILLIKTIGRMDKNQGPLLNCTNGGQGQINRSFTDLHKQRISETRKTRHIKHTKETIEKLKIIKTGKKRSLETRQKISNALLKRDSETQNKFVYSRKDKTNSKEHNKKISDANTGKIVSKQTSEKISKANKNKYVSNETRLKLSKAGKGRIVTEQTRLKLSTSNKGKKRTPKTIKKHRIQMIGKKVSEETKLKISITETGKIVKEDTKQKLANKSAKTWKICFKDKTIIISNLKNWCKENNILYSTNYENINKKQNEFQIKK